MKSLQKNMYFKEESIMMLMPRKKEMDLFDEMFSDPFFSMKESRLMKTDKKLRMDTKLKLIYQDIIKKIFNLKLIMDTLQ